MLRFLSETSLGHLNIQLLFCVGWTGSHEHTISTYFCFVLAGQVTHETMVSQVVTATTLRFKCHIQVSTIRWCCLSSPVGYPRKVEWGPWHAGPPDPFAIRQQSRPLFRARQFTTPHRKCGVEELHASRAWTVHLCSWRNTPLVKVWQMMRCGST